jgi:class 3 adenylate cyclase/cold shock CspA family protein
MAKLTEVFNDPTSRVYRVFLVVDINDSTGMKEREPEANWITSYAWFFDLVGSVVAEYGGNLVKYVGDGALAVFGENEATHAINAAIALLERIRDENRKRLVKFSCSIGIASGEAREFEVVQGAKDYIGSTVDRAFRLCGAANANAVFVDSETTAAANMNRVTSQVGAALNRKTGEYQGPSQLITLKGFASPVSYYEIWWDRDRYGVSAQFVTGSTKKDSDERPATAVVGDQARLEESGTGSDWLIGRVKEWRSDQGFGFIGAGDEDFYFNAGYLFSAGSKPVEGDRVVFLPLDPLAAGKSRRASKLFIVGERIVGRIEKIAARGFGFAAVQGQRGMSHQLFVLLRDLPDAREGDEIEVTIAHNERGPVGARGSIASAAGGADT